MNRAPEVGWDTGTGRTTPGRVGTGGTPKGRAAGADTPMASELIGDWDVPGLLAA